MAEDGNGQRGCHALAFLVGGVVSQFVRLQLNILRSKSAGSVSATVSFKVLTAVSTANRLAISPPAVPPTPSAMTAPITSIPRAQFEYLRFQKPTQSSFLSRTGPLTETWA